LTSFWIIFFSFFPGVSAIPNKKIIGNSFLPVSLSETGKIGYTPYGCMLEHVPGFHVQGYFLSG